MLAGVGIAAWSLVVARAAFVYSTVSSGRTDLWLLDWHVYAAAGRDLLARSLYHVPLEYPGWPLPVEQFNLPPLAAGWAVPFLPLPGDLAGMAWLAVGIGASLAALWILADRILGLPRPWIWAGLLVAAYAQLPSFGFHLALGNINDLMLGLVAVFVVLHLGRRYRAAGIVLGLAAATKIWPLVLAIVLVRERRWQELKWFAITVAVVALGGVAWLGPDVVPRIVDAMRLTVVVEPGNPVLWVTYLREHTAWWPAWGAILLSAGLLAVPARGRLGLGIGVIAGVTLIPNIWAHYLPTMVFGLGLMASTLRSRPNSPHD